MRLKAFDVTGKSFYADIDRDKKLGEGATASIFRVNLDGRQYAAKIYKPERVFSSAKLKAMMYSPPPVIAENADSGENVRFTWVNFILKQENGKVVGFLMPFVDQADTNSLDTYYDPVLIKRLAGVAQSALSLRLEIAKNLCRSIADLHSLGHYFIDIKPQNVRVYRNSHDVVLMDCDGYSIKNDSGSPSRFPADLISTDYIAPEVLKNNIAPKHLGEEQDRYGMAVILFQLLNRGTHPFQGIVTNPNIQVSTNDERAVLGLYPYGLSANPAVKPRTQSIHDLLLPETRSLFDRAFTGSNRPSAQEWTAHFDGILSNKLLSRCQLYPNDVRHIHFKDMGCIGCKIRSETPSQKTVKKTSDYGINYREPKSSGYGSRTFSVSSATKQGSSDNTTLALWTAGIICLAFLFLMSSSGSDKSGSSSSAVPLSSSSSGSPSVVTGDGYIANKSRLEYLVGATGSKEVTLDTVMRGNLRSGYDRIAAKDNYIALAQDIHREVDRVRSNIRIEDGLVVFPQVNLLYLRKFTIGGMQGSGSCLAAQLQPLGTCLVNAGNIRCQLLDSKDLTWCISSMAD